MLLDCLMHVMKCVCKIGYAEKCCKLSKGQFARPSWSTGYETGRPARLPVHFGLGDRYWKKSTGLEKVTTGTPAFFRSFTGIPVIQNR